MTEPTNKTLPESFDSSFGVDAHVPDPVGTGSSKRPADKTGGDPKPSMPKTKMISDITAAASKMSHADLEAKYSEFLKLQNGGDISQSHNLGTIKAHGGVKEDIDAMFEGNDLTEEFREKATTLFEAAVQLRVTERTVELEEEFDAKLAEAVETTTTAIEDSVNKYMDYVTEQWLTENKLAVTTGIRADILESFLGGLKTLFQEHYIEVPEDKVDVVESLTAKVEELENRLNESENKTLESAKQIQEMEAAQVFATVSEGLTDTQSAKLKSLTESIDFTNADEYGAKLKTIVEGFVVKKPAVTPAGQQLNEELDLDDNGTAKPASVDPLVQLVSASIKKQVKN